MDIKEFLNECGSLSDLSRSIFGKENYTNREKCKKLLEENGIDWQKWLEEKKNKPKRYCLFCGKEITDGDYRKKFCNHSCAASHNNKGTVRNGTERKNKFCLCCGKPLTGNQTKFCSHECELKYKYEDKIAQWKNGELSGCDCAGDISQYVRKYMLEKMNYKCEKCGFDKPNPFTNLSVLQIHHIDGDCKNNKEENLQVLCPTCHALTENFGNRNHKSSRTTRYKK